MHRELIGIIGNGVRDVFVEPTTLTLDRGGLGVGFGGARLRLDVNAPARGGKMTVKDIPTELLDRATTVKPGGGGVNSRRAVAMVTGQHEVRYLDASGEDELLKGQLPPELRWLSLRETPRNVVLGHRSDKLVLRAEITPAHSLSKQQLDSIEWTCRGRAVLVNSIKDAVIMNAICRLRSQLRFRLYIVVTSSLSYTFMHDQVLPEADLLIGGGMSLSLLLGPAVPPWSLRSPLSTSFARRRPGQMST